MLLSFGWSVRSSQLPSCRPVDRRRRPVVEALVQTLVVVKPEVAFDARSRLPHRRVVLQVNLLVFQRAPQPLHENIVHAAAPPIHADRALAPAQFAGKRFEMKLRSLVAFKDLRPPPP